MRKQVVAVAVASALAFAVGASAESVDAGSLKPGEAVTVTYEQAVGDAHGLDPATDPRSGARRVSTVGGANQACCVPSLLAALAAAGEDVNEGFANAVRRFIPS